MKKLVNLMAYAAIVFMGVFVSMSLCACSEDYSDKDRIVPTPPPTPTPRDTTTTPDPDPTEKQDTTKWSWNGLVRSDLTFDTTTEMISAYNIGQISNPNRVVFDSIPLVYHLGLELKAPKRVVVESQDSTVLRTAHTNPTLNYSEYIRSSKDSVCSVSTGHVFPTSYYDINATTTSKRGYSLHAGHWEPFKYVTEKAQWASIWNEYKGEVEVNDSVFARYNVHNNLIFKIISNKGQTWYVKREKIVIVDHFLRMKEQGQKPEKKSYDYTVDGLGRMVSLTIGIREDTHMPAIYAHFEGANGHTIFVHNYNTSGSYQGTEQHFVGYDVAEKSNDYDGVGYIKGKFYPGKITYTKVGHDGKCGWVIVCRAIGIDDGFPTQSIDGGYADTRGLKNFYEGNSAYTSPYLKNTSTPEEVNGKMVWHVSGATSEGRAIPSYSVADSSLK